VLPFIDSDSDRAIDQLWMAAGRPQRGLTVSRDAFVHAAQRELFYSTGLDIPEQRFRLCGFQIMDRENSLEQLFFCVFEVVLYRTPDELELAGQWNRNDSGVLPQVSESALYSGAYDGQLNRLLVRGQEWLKATIFSRRISVEPDEQ
jgi:hypothetical protein